MGLMTKEQREACHRKFEKKCISDVRKPSTAPREDVLEAIRILDEDIQANQARINNLLPQSVRDDFDNVQKSEIYAAVVIDRYKAGV